MDGLAKKACVCQRPRAALALAVAQGTVKGMGWQTLVFEPML